MTDAEALIDDIRALKLRVPEFVVPESGKARQRLGNAASLPRKFVDLTAQAIRNNEALTRGGNSGSVEMRDQLDLADAYGPVADELEALALFVRHTVRVALNKAGSNALMTYSMAQRLAKRPETADLAPHVQDMRIALGTRGRKLKAKPAPVPATPGTSTAPSQPSPVTTPSPDTPTKQ
jgi:hypothetical protein